jgi:TolA-binding protein
MCGCAYFNTFYNAKRAFKQAESEREQGGAGAGHDSYSKSIDKSMSLLKFYPKSKYVDDALFLIGMARFHRGEYVQAQSSFEDLLMRFPDSEYTERALFTTGMAALKQGDAAASTRAFEDLARRFPDSRLNIEVVFRVAEADLDRHDYDTARRQLREFMKAHPDSRLVAEAQLRLARTYYEEKRYREARDEYAQVLQQRIEPIVRFEAELNTALSLRAEAEEILSDPLLRQRSAIAPEAEPGQAVPDTTGAAGEDAGEVGDAPPDPVDAAVVDAGAAGAAPPDTAGGLAAVAGEAVPATLDTAGAVAVGADAAAPPAPATARPGARAAAAVADTVALPALTPEQEERRRRADDMLAEAETRLQSLRKSAAKLGRQVELDIELAATSSLRGDPEAALDDLDLIARAAKDARNPEMAARARYEIGEIHRRANQLTKARDAYDQAQKEKPDAVVVEAARKKSQAIQARGAAIDKLRRAPEVLQRWRARPEPPPPDSLTAAAALETDYESLAHELLRVAEIDLLDLDQPLVALREFEQVLHDYPGSLQSPRAAFAIAWIYEWRLRDAERAHAAYAVVARDYPDTPQGRQARAILDGQASSDAGVIEPSSQP